MPEALAVGRRALVSQEGEMAPHAPASRCREEDAAIYQASARNTKGIVSCSGVLEVGTMTEYKIHQRWFAKLKRKAAAKMREIEQSWKHGKEASAESDTLRKISPDRFQRKRRLSGAEAAVPSAPVRETEERSSAAWQEGETESVQHPGLGLINSFAPGEVPTNGEPAPENGEDGERGLLTYICEVMELAPQNAPPKESGAKKKRKDEECKPGVQRPELEKADGSQCSSENGIPGPDTSNSSRREKPTDAQPAQTQPRGRIARGPGPSGIESTRKSASVVGIQDKVQDAPASAPAPAPAPAPASVPAPAPAPVPVPAPIPNLSSEQVYFSLKDMYMESTQAGRPKGEELPPPPHTRVSGESPSGKEPVKARGEKVPMVSGQPTPSMVPPPIKPLNRKRFAPPKPKVEPATASSSSQAPESVAQSLGKALPPASAQVPTPPARRRYNTRDSPSQGRTSSKTPGEVSVDGSVWRLLWETDLMETLAVKAWQPVGGGLLIEGGGEGLEFQPGARGHRHSPCLTMLQTGACRQHRLTMSLFVQENTEAPSRGERRKMPFFRGQAGVGGARGGGGGRGIRVFYSHADATVLQGGDEGVP